jgi:hypothetical protein
MPGITILSRPGRAVKNGRSEVVSPVLKNKTPHSWLFPDVG